MNKEFKEFVTYKSLGVKLSSSSILDLGDVLEDGDHQLEIKNVCTKMSKQLSDRIDNTVQFLDIRKRKFIELAIVQALDDADEIIQKYVIGDDEWIESQQTDGVK